MIYTNSINILNYSSVEDCWVLTCRSEVGFYSLSPTLAGQCNARQPLAGEYIISVQCSNLELSQLITSSTLYGRWCK